MEDLGTYQALSEKILGWTRGEEAAALARVSYALRADAVIVEIGSFLGSSTVLLAEARRLRGSGKVHSVDPFDGSGDAFSVPHYERAIGILGGTLREHFDRNMELTGLRDWIEVHQGCAREIAAAWAAPIDMLYLDGDQSPAGAREAYEAWFPFLKPGSVIALHNSAPRAYTPDHDGYFRIATEEIHAPDFKDVHLVGTTTFAQRAVPKNAGAT